MNFFEQQDRARASSHRLYMLYALALIVGGLIIVNRPARRQIPGEVPDA